jgi:hypothetical protein
MYERNESENRLRDFRLGKAGEEIDLLKQRVKDLTKQLRNNEETHSKKIEEYEDKVKALVALHHRSMDYCNKLSEFALHMFKLKEIDITETELRRIFQDS